VNGQDCEYCGYAYCECGEAYKPVWIPVKERLPDPGVAVLWCDPTDRVWPAFVGKRDGQSVDYGGDLASPIKQAMCWMHLPAIPVIAIRGARRNKNH